MYCLELTKLFDVSNTSYYVKVEKWCTGARRRTVMENDPWRSWKVVENFYRKSVRGNGTLEIIFN